MCVCVLFVSLPPAYRSGEFAAVCVRGCMFVCVCSSCLSRPPTAAVSSRLYVCLCCSCLAPGDEDRTYVDAKEPVSLSLSLSFSRVSLFLVNQPCDTKPIMRFVREQLLRYTYRSASLGAHTRTHARTHTHTHTHARTRAHAHTHAHTHTHTTNTHTHTHTHTHTPYSLSLTHTHAHTALPWGQRNDR